MQIKLSRLHHCYKKPSRSHITLSIDMVTMAIQYPFLCQNCRGARKKSNGHESDQQIKCKTALTNGKGKVSRWSKHVNGCSLSLAYVTE